MMLNVMFSMILAFGNLVCAFFATTLPTWQKILSIILATILIFLAGMDFADYLEERK